MTDQLAGPAEPVNPYVRKLSEGDRQRVMELIDRDRIMGSLVHSFVVRRGLESSQEFFGLFDARPGTGNANDDQGWLAGLFTLDTDGRSTVLGGGPEYAPVIAGFMRERNGTAGTGVVSLAFIDAPRETAAPLAALLAPSEVESLGVWVHDGREWNNPPALPHGLDVRPVDPDGESAGLQTLYEADDTFRELGVNVGDSMEAVRRGLRLMLVGVECNGGIVSAAFGWLTDRHVARVSGVVTHPERRGRGYATAVVGELTRRLLAGGRRPFLYVSLGNTPAVRVYERLGYRPHAVVDKLRYGRVRY